MRLMKEVDPEGVEARKGRRLRRRTYSSKVIIFTPILEAEMANITLIYTGS